MNFIFLYKNWIIFYVWIIIRFNYKSGDFVDYYNMVVVFYIELSYVICYLFLIVFIIKLIGVFVI